MAGEHLNEKVQSAVTGPAGAAQPVGAPTRLSYAAPGSRRPRLHSGTLVVLGIIALGVVLGLIGLLYRAPTPTQKQDSAQDTEATATDGDAETGEGGSPAGEQAPDAGQ